MQVGSFNLLLKIGVVKSIFSCFSPLWSSRFVNNDEGLFILKLCLFTISKTVNYDTIFFHQSHKWALVFESDESEYRVSDPAKNSVFFVRNLNLRFQFQIVFEKLPSM